MPHRAVLLTLALAALSCGDGPAKRAPRPPASAAVPRRPSSPCSEGGGSVADGRFAAWFPRRVGGFCLDPNADQRVFGKGAPLPLGEAADLLALDADRLERSGLERVVSLTYVEDAAQPARAGASVLAFSSPEIAYAFFTARIAEATELGHPVYSAFDGGAAAVRGDVTALVVRGEAVLRLDYTNARLPPERVAQAAAPVLALLGSEIGRGLPGPAKLPPAARLLPERERLPLSLRYDAVDLAGLEGVGPGALAAYSDGGARYRMALAVRLDPDAAKDVLSTLKKRDGSRVVKHGPYDALRVAENDEKSGSVREWIFGRKGALVAGVALDAPPRAAPRGAPPERGAAVLKLKHLLDGLPASAAW